MSASEGANRARAIVSALLDDDTDLAARLLDDLDIDEAENAIIDLSTEVAGLLGWLAEELDDDPQHIWMDVLLDRLHREET